MDTAPTPSTAPAPALVLALRRVLRPLVRLMLARGLTYTYVTDLLKALFVEVAEKDFRIDGKSPTDSRVSLVSGVHRKEVNRIRQEMGSDVEIVPSVVSLGAQLVAVWLGSAQYLDENKQPKPLARFASDGGDMSFEALVANVNSDIRSRVVLDEWLRLGVVHMDEHKRVCLNVQAFIPAAGFDEKAFYFGHNLHDHVAAASHNLLGTGKPFLERSLHSDALSEKSIAELATLSEQLGMQTLLALNERATALEEADTQADPAGSTPKQRMTIGVYFYSEEAPQAPQTLPVPATSGTAT